MDDKLTIMLIEDDPEACGKIINEIAQNESFAIVGVTNNSERAMQCIKDMQPDCAVLDMDCAGSGESLEFLKKLKKAGAAPHPYTLAICDGENKPCCDAARENGADFILDKNRNGFSAKSVADFLCITMTVISSRRERTVKTTASPPEELDEKRLLRRITGELDKVGISSKCVGYRYLTEAIAIIMKQPVQHVCRIIGKNYGKTENSVERAMQNAINRAWASTDKRELAANYTARIKSTKCVPTITEFVFHYAQKLNNEF